MWKKRQRVFSTFGEGKTEEEEEVENSIKREMHFFEGGYTKKCAILFSVPLALLFSWMHFCLRRCIIFAVVHVNSLSGWGTHSLHILNINVVHSFYDLFMYARCVSRDNAVFHRSTKKKGFLCFCVSMNAELTKETHKREDYKKGSDRKSGSHFHFIWLRFLKHLQNEKCKWRLWRR